jgi:hypothetical protein
MTTLPARTALGVLTGGIALVAMLRLVAGAFTGAMSGFALGVTLVAMVPWLAYVTWRARRSRLTGRAALTVLVLDAVGLVLVFVFVFGPVLALALSFAAFVLVWIGDRPRREGSLLETYVRVEDLREPAPDDPDDLADEDVSGEEPGDEGGRVRA